MSSELCLGASIFAFYLANALKKTLPRLQRKNKKLLPMLPSLLASLHSRDIVLRL